MIYISVANILKYYFTRWCPTLPVDFSPIRRMFNFSSKMLLTNMLTVISQSVLTFIFGKLSAQNLLSISEVGLFNHANKWNTMGSSLISNTMAQVAQPVLANVNNEEERQERVFRKMLRFASFLSFPMMFGLSLVAHEFILTTVGPTWESCVPLLQMLCVGGACLPLQGLYQNFIISRGRSDIYLRLVALQIVLQIVLTLSLSAYGISVMVAAFSALNVLYTGCWHLGLRRIHALSATDVLKDTVPFAVLAAVVMVATHFLTLAVDVIWLLLLVRIIVAGALYFVVMRLLNVDILQECLAFAKSRFL